ncbi:MAG: GDSL-type esterase/lipase family protein [Patescibacteria group bacterium]|nr:GDSL-type esterase/lipase family protein [Patescibacteria group bacterium]
MTIFKQAKLKLMARILIFGDSIVFGNWDKQGGWANRLKNYYMKESLDNSDYYMVYNIGVSGDTSSELLERFEFEIKHRLWEGKDTGEKEEIIIVISIGNNDAAFVKSKNEFNTTLDNFDLNIKQLLIIAKKYSTKIFFVGLSLVDETKTMPVQWDFNIEHSNKNIEKYNKIIKLACKEEKIYFINMYEEFKKLDYKKLLEDGVHPNSEGHKKMFEIVRDFLAEKEIVK